MLDLGAPVGIFRMFRELRTGAFDDAELEKRLDPRGFMNRFLGRRTLLIRKPWRIYPLGVLFGLGFDAASEVSLLVLAGGAAAFNLPFYATPGSRSAFRCWHVPGRHGRRRTH
ncbi:hypothetical protein GCM10027090_39580 [Sinomonas soli]